VALYSRIRAQAPSPPNLFLVGGEKKETGKGGRERGERRKYPRCAESFHVSLTFHPSFRRKKEIGEKEGEEGEGNEAHKTCGLRDGLDLVYLPSHGKGKKEGKRGRKRRKR